MIIDMTSKRLTPVLTGAYLVVQTFHAAAAPDLPRPPAPKAFDFVAFGDAPYSMAQYNNEFVKLLAAINRVSPKRSFSVHVGDIGHPDDACTLCRYDERSCYRDEIRRDLKNHLDGVAFYTPGDNEWTDCGKGKGERSLANLRALFFSGDISVGNAPANKTAVRQSKEMPLYAEFPENIRMAVKDALIATVHVVGSMNGRDDFPEEYKRRDAANVAWIGATFDHAIKTRATAVVFFWQAAFDCLEVSDKCPDGKTFLEVFDRTKDAVKNGAARFDGDVLVVHGDNHIYECGKLRGTDGKVVVTKSGKPVLRYQVFGDKIVDAIRVTVDTDASRHGRPVFTLQESVFGRPIPKCE